MSLQRCSGGRESGVDIGGSWGRSDFGIASGEVHLGGEEARANRIKIYINNPEENRGTKLKIEKNWKAENKSEQ